MRSSTTQTSAEKVSKLQICFAGDSGDGIQRMGQQFALSAAALANDVRTQADFPAEIRAPSGSVEGISQFSVCLAQSLQLSMADYCDVLVVFNTAALKKTQHKLTEQGLLILHEEAFSKKSLEKVGLAVDTIEQCKRRGQRVMSLPLTDLTLTAVHGANLSHANAKRCKNFFTLGLLIALYDRDLSVIENWVREKWAADDKQQAGVLLALQGGYAYAYNTELSLPITTIPAAKLPAGDYRSVTGNEALVFGMLSACARAGRHGFFAGYPITPASSILQSLSHYASEALTVFQAEDELAAVNACVGASFGGAISVTATSGPGLDLKMEGIGLAVMANLPMVVVDVQRAGPSTGMPTKTAQTDLQAAIDGRHGEASVPVLAASSVSDCYDIMMDAVEIAIANMRPVILLSDGQLAGCSESWRLPDAGSQKSISHNPLWVTPGTPGGEHVRSGLEQDSRTGEVTGEAASHCENQRHRDLTQLVIPESFCEVLVSDEETFELAVISWGSTYGVVQQVIASSQLPIAHYHCRQCWPIPASLIERCQNKKRCVVLELNQGQFAQRLKAVVSTDIQTLTKITGQTFNQNELREQLLAFIQGEEITS